MEETIRVRLRTRWRAIGLVGALSLLLAQFIVWAGPSAAQVATANTLYGADGAGGNDNATLYTINPANGTKTSVVGAIGFAVSGLAVDPTTGELYGSTGDSPDPDGSLIKIDKETGEGSLIGEIVPDCDSGTPDITFTTDGQLWGWSNCNDSLVKINKATGDGVEVGTGIVGDAGQGNGLSADPDDNTLWLTPDHDDGDYYTVDKATGAGTSQGVLDGNNGAPINSLAWSCDGETLFGTANVSFGTGDREFIPINTATDHITVLGGPVGVDPQQDAIAWDCAPPPPVAQCKGLAATLVGTSGADVLTGTAARDVVAALGGNDRIAGLGGNDLICAGAGKDRANGGGGKDRVLGQGGNDRLRGAAGKDNLRGGGGFDRCNGGAGIDKGRCEIERNIP